MATEPKPDVSKEISRIEKTPMMQVGDRVYSNNLKKLVEITGLGKDRARIRTQSGMGFREHDVPTSDLRPHEKGRANAVLREIESRSSSPTRVGGGGGGRGGSGGGGAMPDIDRLGKNPLNMAKGGSVSSASKRADGCAVKGKTRGKMV